MANIILEDGSGALTQETGSYLTTEDATTSSGVTGTGAFTDTLDAVLSAGTVVLTGFFGDAAVNEARDLAYSAGTVSTQGSGALIEPADIITSTGGGPTVGDATVIDAADTFAGRGSTYDQDFEITGSGGFTEAEDIVQGANQPNIGGVALINDLPDLFIGVGSTDSSAAPTPPPTNPKPPISTATPGSSGWSQGGANTGSSGPITITVPNPNGGSGSGGGSGGDPGGGSGGGGNPTPGAGCLRVVYTQTINQESDAKRQLSVDDSGYGYMPRVGDLIIALFVQRGSYDVFNAYQWNLLVQNSAGFGQNNPGTGSIYYRYVTDSDIDAFVAGPLEIFQAAEFQIANDHYAAGELRVYRMFDGKAFSADTFQQYSARYYASGPYEAENGYTTTVGEYVCIALGTVGLDAPGDVTITTMDDPSTPVGTWYQDCFKIFSSVTQEPLLVNPGIVPVGVDINVTAPKGYFILRYTLKDPCLSNVDGGGIYIPPGGGTGSNSNANANTITITIPPFVAALPTKPVGIAPVKRLPQPPKTYDPRWMQANQDAIIQHLNTLVSNQTANPNVILRDTSTGHSYKVEITDGEIVKTRIR